MNINGEELSPEDVLELKLLVQNEAKQVAGEFHNMNRSEKFRKNWPNEYVFADTQYRNFIAATRLMLTKQLSDDTVPVKTKNKIAKALIIQAMESATTETDNRLQLAPNTQQFVGDKYENRKIVDQFGKKSNTFKELLLGSSAVGSTIN